MPQPTPPHPKKRTLIIFDVEGVLIPRNRLFFDVANSLGLSRLVPMLFFGFLYEVGLLPLKVALRKLFWCMRGASVELFSQKLANLPVMPHAAQVFQTLKAEGYKIALISAGFPTFSVEQIAKELGADYAIGVQAGLNGNLLTGEVSGDVAKPQGKYRVLQAILTQEHLSAADCVIVADDRNNASIFLKDALKIGYNPDFIIRIKADAVITGKLQNIIPVIHGDPKKPHMPSRNDFTRELIHGSGFFMPLLAILLGVPIVAAFIGTVLVLYCVSELARINGKNLPIFSSITRHAASQSELCEFTFAPIFFALGILLTLLLFSAPASYAAVAIFALGDSSASLIGSGLAGKPLLFNRAKTLEGSLGGFFFAFLAGSVFVSPWIALIGAVVGMFVEYLPLPLNDNLLIPLLTGLALTALI
jgi:dolichol kinase/phosphoserine phosphatase